MRLSSLLPCWLIRNGERIGLVFLCPHCVATQAAKPTPVSSFCIPSPAVIGWPEDSGQCTIFDKLTKQPDSPYAGYDPEEFVPCRKGIAWNFAGSDFDTLSVTPSIDASASGHWHGFITNGEAT
jgi:uncharacterized protein DUF6527